MTRPLLAKAHEHHQEILEAEGLELMASSRCWDSAVKLGFALSLNGYWQLLPAVYRYLEHFESLSASGQDDSFDEPQGGGKMNRQRWVWMRRRKHDPVRV